MKICNKCKAVMESSSKFCIHCGTRSGKPIYQKWWFWTIAAFVFLFILGSIGGKDNGTSTPVSSGTKVVATQKPEKTKLEKALESAIEVDYKVLHKDYIDNPINADSMYKDKMLVLVGKINTIDREIAGQPYITFDVDGLFNNVRITFDKDEEEKVTKLVKGQTVKIVGKCKGTLLSTTVALNNCLVVE
ncbi:MAG: tRNA_anti-like protein [Firmicutes bacterium ADurb.Bin193]|nr:MAG: tRNA_anti-like protein [Firmicutes bacterium ADurb.Bin193]